MKMTIIVQIHVVLLVIVVTDDPSKSVLCEVSYLFRYTSKIIAVIWSNYSLTLKIKYKFNYYYT